VGPSPHPPDDEPGADGQPDSVLRSWFGWLLPRPAPRAGSGGAPFALGPRSGPASPLANAYAQRSSSPAPPRAPAAAVWLEREPEHSADPVPHREWRREARNDRWTLLGASVRGKLHAHQAMWRDDSFGWDRVDDWTCLAVADGAGSAPLSRIGSRVACRVGLDTLKTALAGWRPTPGDDGAPRQADLQKLRGLLVAAARRARAAVLCQADERRRPARDFHTTCLLVVHVPVGDRDLVGSLQIGDGAVGLYTGPGAGTVLGAADHGAFSSETCFLTAEYSDEDLASRTVFAAPHGLRGLAVMTDGVADDFFPEAKRLVEVFDGDPVAELRAVDGEPLRGLFHGVIAEPRDGAALADWLRYEKRGSSDDRTLVLFYREPESGA
jgi:hypothetical protein